MQYTLICNGWPICSDSLYATVTEGKSMFHGQGRTIQWGHNSRQAIWRPDEVLTTVVVGWKTPPLPQSQTKRTETTGVVIGKDLRWETEFFSHISGTTTHLAPLHRWQEQLILYCWSERAEFKCGKKNLNNSRAFNSMKLVRIFYLTSLIHP